MRSCRTEGAGVGISGVEVVVVVVQAAVVVVVLLAAVTCGPHQPQKSGWGEP